MPARCDFSGMELRPDHVASPTMVGKTSSYVPGGQHVRRRHIGRMIAVDVVEELRPIRERPAPASRGGVRPSVRSTRAHPTWGTCRVVTNRRTRPGRSPMPSAPPGLLASLEEELQARGRCPSPAARARAASRTAGPRPVASSVREPCPKLPTPGISTRSARRTAVGIGGEAGRWPPAASARTTLFEVVHPVVHHAITARPWWRARPSRAGSMLDGRRRARGRTP